MSLDIALAPDITVTFGVPVMIHMVPGAAPFNDGLRRIILVHNHPSGDPTPSQDDIAMTKEVAAAADKLGISVHDHIIIGRKGHASLRSLGHL